MKGRWICLGLSFAVWSTTLMQWAWAYDKGTHKVLGEKAADSSSRFDDALKADLGFLNGKNTEFSGKTAKELISEGAESEDIPDTRVLNHFHNPLASQWADAGLRASLGAVRGQSSVLWQQNTNQNLSLVFMPAPFPSLGGNWSWQDTRKRYLDALTGETKEQRDQAFADTFLGLGHLMHLVQDASVPAHVRNDPHPSATVPGLGSKIGNPDWYEDWIEEARENAPSLFQGFLNSYNKDLHRPPFSLFMPTNNAQAPVPIARLIDSDKLLGLNFSVLTDPNLGVSEYTNGNFLSRDTIFSDFDLPRQTSLDPNFIVEPVGAKFRRYLQKVSEGESVRHFVSEGLLYTTLKEAVDAGPVPAGGWTLDDEHVHVDYAAKLLPRAVGYSAALLDYFFRGGLFAFGDTSSLAFANYSQEPREPMEGSFTLYYDDVEEKRHPVPGASWTLTLGAGDYQGGFRFSEPVDPVPLEPGSYTLVFQGAFGGEAEAVVGKRVVIPSVLTVRLLTRIYGNPLWGYKVEAVEHGSGKVLTWARTDRNGKASMQWKPGKILIRIQTPVPVTRDPTIYWAGGNDFSSAAEGAKIVTHAEVDSKGELIITLPGIIFPQSISAVEPCTGLLKAEIPCRLANVDCLADDPSWQRPQIDNYWPDSYGTAGSLLSASGAPTGEAVYMIGSGVSPITFIRDDIGEETQIINAYEWTGKRIIPDALHAEDLNRIGVPIGRLVVSYRADYARYVENEDGEMIGNPICSGSYGETVSLPVWLADYDRPAR